MNAADSPFVEAWFARWEARLKELEANNVEITPQLEEEAKEDTFCSTVEAAELLAPRLVALFNRGVRTRLKKRHAHNRKVRRSNLKHWGVGFREFDGLVAATDDLLHEMGDATMHWFFREGEFQKGARLLNSTLIGGQGMKAFLFLSLQARACAIASEVRLLAEHGFPDGMRARIRSLYETVVIMGALAIGESAKDYEIAERYCAWAAFETEKDLEAAKRLSPSKFDSLDDDNLKDFKAAAVNRWGRRFIKGHGWALPLFPGEKRVDFAALDGLAGIEEMRFWYLDGNHAIHAGPRSVMSRFDLERHWDPHVSGPEVDRKVVRAMMYIATRMIEQSCFVSCRQIAAITGALDLPFALNAIFERTTKSCSNFEQGDV